jgi:uncharacterized protein (DUF1015 family)
MSIVLPFKALRPQKQFVQQVASHPYDVVSVEEAKNMVKNNSLSFLHVEKSEIDVDPLVEEHDDRIYDRGKSNLDGLIQQGILFREESPCFYVYRQRMGEHGQYGVVARVSLAEYESGKIKKHELTRENKQIDRTKHVDKLNANTGPVFLTYKAQNLIDRMVEGIIREEPEYDFLADDGISHTVWVVRDENRIKDLKDAFAMVDALYIADGHHRAAAASAVRRFRKEQNPDHTGDESYNFVLAVIFPHDQLKVMDYNRVVKDLRGLGVAEFLDKVSEKFLISEDFKEKAPQSFHDFGMYLQGKWFKLTARDGSFNELDPIEVLDVSILQDNLFGPLLGIQDPRIDRRIDFVGGIRGMKELEKLVDSGKFAVAFSLFPTSLTQLMDVADAGKTMPPKSTWFEPKLRSGIFVNFLS